MPIYEYKCKKCGHKFSVLQSILARLAVTPCPECGSKDTERLVSSFGSGKSSKSCSSGGPFT